MPPRATPPSLAADARRLLAPWFTVRRFAAGSLLWREGETAGLLVALNAGRVKIYRQLPTGRAVTLFIFGPDDVFGFLPLLDGEPYPAFAQALDDVTAEVMTRDDLVRAVAEKPELSMSLLACVGRRLREAFDTIERLSTPGVTGRVAAAIQGFVPGGEATSTTVVEFPVSSAELAAALGITPETLSRSISRLATQGVVRRLGPRRLQVLDPRALAESARVDGP
jgi:CRP/FNR family transcriptional regulator, dissimilatory nitrate respiration regulator